MPFNQPSFIDQMTAPQAGQSQRKSVPILNTSELEIPALSFEGIGSNTVHSKETATIIAAKDVDITTVYGELRPNTKLDFERLPSLSLYTPPYEHPFGKLEDCVSKRMFFGKYIMGMGSSVYLSNLMGTLAVYFSSESEVLVGLFNINNGCVSGYYNSSEASETSHVIFRTFESPRESIWSPEPPITSADFLSQGLAINDPFIIEIGRLVK